MELTISSLHQCLPNPYPKKRRTNAINKGKTVTTDRNKLQYAATNRNAEKENMNPTLKQTRLGPTQTGRTANVERDRLITSQTAEEEIDLFLDVIEWDLGSKPDDESTN